MPNLVGTGLNQVPTNGMLGGLAYQSPDHASIKDLDLKNLSQINSEIADTARDIFIYDTSKDSDGGAWRKRTTHTSWYNETLGTATRGTRREFPAVAILVLEQLKLTIYDGDDPDMPMWMIFNQTNTKSNGNCTMLGANDDNHFAISALNGVIAVGENESYGGLVEIMFARDTARRRRGGVGNNGTNGYWTSKYISTRNTGNTGLGRGYDDNNTDTANIVTDNVNDVAMTVLPNAPIDDATGLPIPTIAVATNGGVSVIKDDGSVYDTVATTSGYIISRKVEFENEYLHIIQDPSLVYTYKISSFNQDRSSGTLTGYTGISGYNSWISGSGAASATKLAVKDNSTINIGHLNTGLSRLYPDYTYTSNSLDSDSGRLVSIATTSYNTGWMHGDIKGAFLSDTDATNVTGSELIPNPGNGNFTATTDWQATSSGGSLSINNSNLRVSCTGNYQGCKVNVSNLPTLIEGNQYIMTVDVAAVSGGSLRFGVVSGSVYNGTIGGDGIFSMVLTAGASITEIFVDNGTSGSMYFELNSVNLRLAELDRSVNGGVNYPAKGLGVYGTVTKSAVATGAELVGYSGFSGSNYLMQPYNSDLDVGTGDISVIGWFKSSNSSGGYFFERMDPARTGNRLRGYITNSTYQFLISSSAGVVISNQNYLDGTWHFYSGIKRGSVMYLYVDGRLLGSTDVGTNSVTNTSANLSFGIRSDAASHFQDGNMALWRVSASAPSAEQIKKIYEDEKVLFQENAACTLYGSSDAVTALAYDEVTQRLHVGTSGGRSEFQGLRRINNTTTAVTTAISAYDSFVVEQ